MATFYGTSLNDYYDYNGSESLYADGLGGSDTIWGNTNNDTIYGDAGNDRLYGWTGNDRLYGESGSDYLSGGDGSDRLLGSWSTLSNGYEYDTLAGGSGSDRFVVGSSSGNFYRGGGYATITDYNSLYDYIEISNASRSSLTLNKSSNWGGTSALDTAIYQAGDLIAIVQDNTSLQISTYDFVFV